MTVYKFDRFSRNKYETAIYKKALRDNGVKVISATELIPDSPEGIIFESMLEGYAEYYSAELSQKVRRGMNETRLKGNYTGGHILYGYKKQDKKLVIDEERAEVVRFIFEQYSIGVYVKNILLELDRRGVTYKGKPFVRSTVYNILKNEKYAGIYHFNGQIIENMFPQIVPTDIFEKVRAKVQKNHYGKHSVQVVYLLRNNVICANGQHKILKAAELNVDQSRNPISDYGFPINLFFIINFTINICLLAIKEQNVLYYLQ